MAARHHPRGIYVLIGHDHYGKAGRNVWGSIPNFLGLLLISPIVGHMPKLNVKPPDKQAVMAELKELLETGKLTPVVERTYPLSGAVEAMAYLQSGKARGKLILIS